MCTPPTSTPITAQQFRNNFPEFSSTTDFPDSAVNFWLTWAYTALRPERWRSMLALGVQMWVAHNLVIEAFNNQTVDVGGLPGVNKGAIASETPGSVAISYDTANASVLGAGDYNLTSYGTRYARMRNMAGMGPIQIGTPGCEPSGAGFGAPWFGPPGGFYRG